MDLIAEIDRAVDEMEWKEMVFILLDTIYKILGNTTTPVPVGLEHNAYLQPAENQDGGYNRWSAHGAAPLVFEQQNPMTAGPNPYIHCGPLQKQVMQTDHLYTPFHLYTQAGPGLALQTHPQPGPRPGRCIPLGAASHVFEQQNSMMAAPSPSIHCGPLQEEIMQPRPACTQTGPSSHGQYNDASLLRLPEGNELNLCCVGVLNGQMLYEVPADLAPHLFAPPPPYASNSNNGQVLHQPPAPLAFAHPPPNAPKKRGCYSQQDDGQPYIKRPLNAFMLFMKEQRPNVDAEITSKGSAVVNTVLGERWKALSTEGQAKYFEKANRERLLHAERHPQWSSNNNYGKKRKRQRGKTAHYAKASASKPEGDTQPDNKLFCRPPQTQVLVTQREMEPSSSQRDVMEALHKQHTETLVAVTLCHTCHLQKVHEVRHDPCLDAPTAASTSQASPAARTWSPTSQRTSEDRCHPATEQPEAGSSPPVKEFWTLDINQLSL